MPKTNEIRSYLRIVFLGTLALVLAACGSGAASVVPESESRVADSLTDVRDGVVRLEGEGDFEYPDGHSERASGTGSGFFVSEDGYVVTNNHVVAGADDIKVHVDGHSAPLDGVVVGASECSDLAVVDVDVSHQTFLAWSEEDVSVGQEIFVAGFPLGDPEYTLIDGIVSKESANGDSDWASISAVIEHSGDTLPGSSGGPIVNPKGEVLAVNYAGDDFGQAFGISSATARGIVEDILAARPTHSTGVNAWAYEGDHGSGVWVSSVEANSPADRAGIRPGDLITELDGLIVGSDLTMSTFCQVLRQSGSNAPVDFVVWRQSTGGYHEGALFSDRSLVQVEDHPIFIGEPAPPTSGRASSVNEQLLIEFMREWSLEQPYLTVVDSMDDQAILDFGYATCEALASGVAPSEILQSVIDNVLLERDQLDFAGLIGAAVAALCPEHERLLG